MGVGGGASPVVRKGTRVCQGYPVIVELPFVPCSALLAMEIGCCPLGVACSTAAALATESTGNSCVGFGGRAELERLGPLVTTTN